MLLFIMWYFLFSWTFLSAALEVSSAKCKKNFRSEGDQWRRDRHFEVCPAPTRAGIPKSPGPFAMTSRRDSFGHPAIRSRSPSCGIVLCDSCASTRRALAGTAGALRPRGMFSHGAATPRPTGTCPEGAGRPRGRPRRTPAPGRCRWRRRRPCRPERRCRWIVAQRHPRPRRWPAAAPRT